MGTGNLPWVVLGFVSPKAPYTDDTVGVLRMRAQAGMPSCRGSQGVSKGATEPLRLGDPQRPVPHPKQVKKGGPKRLPGIVWKTGRKPKTEVNEPKSGKNEKWREKWNLVSIFCFCSPLLAYFAPFLRAGNK